MHKIIRRYLYITVSVLLLSGVLSPEKVDALGWPHDEINSCAICHAPNWQEALYGFSPNCLACHDKDNATEGAAPDLPFDGVDAANPFGTFSAIPGQKQISHSWGVPYTNANAGATKGSRFISERAKNLSCASCHYAHKSIHPKGLRIWTDESAESLQRNGLCISCHSARNVTKADGNAAPKTNSHPVNVQFTDISSHNYPPLIDVAYQSISSSALKLFSTVGGKDTVHCMSCHGVHYTDSNPFTEDVAPKYPNYTNMSSGDGYLLRRYNDSTMCNDCHKFQGHGKDVNVMTCRNCHQPHNVGNNTKLIMQNISTPMINGNNYGDAAVVLKLYTARGFVTDDRNGKGICEVCHSLTVDSLSGPGAIGEGVFRRWSTNHSGRKSADDSLIIISQASNYDCRNCHPHADGVGIGSFMPSAGACSICHGQPPQRNYTGTEVEDGYAYLEASSYGYNDTGGVFKNESTTPHKTHAVEYDFGDKGSGYGTGIGDGKCRACHNNADSSHQQGNDLPSDFQDVEFGLHSTSAGAGRGTYTPASGLCSTLYCHSNGAPWNGGPSYADPTWSDNYVETTCNSCHSNPPITNAHAKHTDAPYSFDCAYCHNNTVENYSTITTSGKSTYHVNREKDVSFSGRATAKGANPNYDDVNHKCSDTWCHGNQPGIMNNITVAWNGSAMTCTSCHENPNTSSSHAKHVTIYNFTCERCHNYRMTGNAMGNYTGHVDGIKDIDFNFEAGIDNTGGGVPYVDGTDECDNIYCHSRGTDLVAPFDTSTSHPIEMATWGGDSSACNYCHGNSTYGGYTAAMPNYPDVSLGGPKENSHVEHVVDNNISCMSCHEGTLSANNTIGNYALHVNIFYNVDINNKYDGAGAATYNAGTCTNVKCHGSNPVVWGTPTVDCSDCHNSAGDTDDFTWTNITSASMTMAQISQKQYTSTGHGRNIATQYYDSVAGNFGAAKTCDNCHDGGVDHGTASNPFRLHTSDTVALCDNCHGTGAEIGKVMVAPYSVISSVFHHASTTTDGRWDFDIKCIDCHDPHGDDNIFMIHSTLPQPETDPSGYYEPSDQYGVVKPAVTLHNVDFSANADGSDFASLTGADNSTICNVCHTQTKKPGFSDSRYRRDMVTGTQDPHTTDKCTSCHKHDAGLEGAGCSGCHGNPPIDVGTLISIPSASGSDSAGAHDKHITKGFICLNCHFGGGTMYPSASQNARIDLGFGSLDNYTTGTYDGQIGLLFDYSGAGKGTANDSRICNDVKCHGSGGWLTAGGTDNMILPNWTSVVVCGNCHGAKKTKAQVGASWPTTGKHLKHAGTGAGEYDIMCKDCHNATVLTSATTLSNANHVNAKSQVQFATGLANDPDLYSNYSVNSLNDDSCDRTYCHSRAHDTTVGNYSAPNASLTWLDAGGASCNSCHGSSSYGGYTAAMPDYASGSPKINSHKQHVVDNGIACYACHYDTTQDAYNIYSTSMHVNKSYDVKVPKKYDDNEDTDYATNGYCNVDCHDNVNTNLWGGASYTCSDCHLKAGDVDNFSFTTFSAIGMAKIDITQWGASGHGRASGTYTESGNVFPNPSVGCASCHDSGIEHNKSGNYFRLMTSGNPDGLCLGCHGDSTERAGKSWNSFSNLTGIQSHTYDNLSAGGYGNLTTWQFTPKCVDCHDPHGDTNIFMIHEKISDEGSSPEGRPTGFPDISTIVFTSLTDANSYDNDASDDAPRRLCAACHDRTDHNGDDGGSHANAGKECRECHNHKTGFTPSGDCPDCHYADEDVDDFVFGNAPAGKAMVNQQQYTSVGHGKFDIDCLQCHDDTIDHDTPGRYFRLYTSDTDALCGNCHGSGGALGVWTTAMGNKQGIFTHNSSNAQGNNNFALKCVDCHDPHGDDNIFMLHSTFALPNADNNYKSSDVFGRPTSIAWSNVDFTSNTNGFGYATSVAEDGIERACNVCHTRTQDAGETLSRFQRDMNGESLDVHNTDKKCVNCHAHSGGFKGVACDGCHGNPPVGSSTLVGGSANFGEYSTLSVTAGMHDTHINILTDSDKCRRCHDGGMSVAFSLNSTINMGFAGGLTYNVYSTGLYEGQNIVESGPNYKYAGDISGTSSTFVCSNVKCHGASWLPGGTDTTPVWNSAPTGDCGNCHAVKKTSGGGWVGQSPWMDSNKHITHADPATYNIMCQTCHKATILSNNTTLSSTHVNEQSMVEFDTAHNRTNEGGTYTDATYDVNGAVGSCSGIYCHSEGNRFSNYSAPNETKDWSQATTCDSCHVTTSTGPDYDDNTIGGPKANSHNTHVFVEGIGCEECHSVTTTNGSTINDPSVHVNKTYDIDPAAGWDNNGAGSNYSYAAPGGTCNSIKCHGVNTGVIGAGAFGNDTTPTWGDESYATCSNGNCHLNKTSAPKITAGAHEMHVGGTTSFYDFACTDCHSPDTDIDHVNGFINFTAGNDLANTGTCAVCHNYLGNDAGNAKSVWDSPVTRPCGTAAACHSGKADEGNMPGKHITHVSAASGYEFGCVNCHELTASDNTTIDASTGTANHADTIKTVNFDFSGGIDNDAGSYDSPAASQCANIYCHSPGHEAPTAGNYSTGNVQADWTEAAAIECNYCHGEDRAFLSITSAMPDYVTNSPKANTHARHVIDKGILCDVCHSGTTSDNATINDKSLHVNGFYNVSVRSPYINGTFNYDGPTRVCTNVTCHGDAMADPEALGNVAPQQSPAWGGTAPCGSCHLTDTTTPRISQGGHMKHVGDVPANYNFGCPTCHSASLTNTTTHVNTLVNFTAVDSVIGDTGVCDQCHNYNGSSDVPDAKQDWYSTPANRTRTCGADGSCHSGKADEGNMPGKHQKHVTAASGYEFGCVNCHELTASDNTTIDASTGTANHADTIKTVNFDFSGGIDNDAGSYDSPGASQCANIYCHSPGHIAATVGNYSTGNNQADWTAGAIGCDYCHGGGYTGITSAMPYYVTGSPKANSHEAHVVNNGFMCNICHASTTTDNVSISNKSVHVDGFYNVSVIPANVAGAFFKYSSVSKQCLNVTCHGGASSITPAWGTAAFCSDCHVTGAADNNDYGVDNGTVATHNQTEWENNGHGISGYNMGCENCHDSGVGHSLTTNPYRLYTSDPNALCFNCHGTGSQLGAYTTALSNISGYVTHTKTATGGNANWTQFENETVKCVDCHDPHGDNNRKMIQAMINYSGSDKYGSPAPDFSTVDPSAVATVNFTTVGGGLINWSSFVKDTSFDGLCQRCHDTEVANFDKGEFTNHNAGTGKCPSCHKHTTGFKGAGESTGNQPCTASCHTLYDEMQTTTGFHHVMNSNAIGYPVDTQFNGGEQTSTDRRCLMCHVDHDVFSPAGNTFGKGVRAKNLRATADLSVTPNANDANTFVNTDFWPAKSSAARADGTANYVDSDPVSYPSGNGVCIGCHVNDQTKNTAKQKGNSTTIAKSFSLEMYTSSSHNFQILSSMNNFAGDQSSFRANCTKCHNSRTMNKDDVGEGQNGSRFKFGLHDRKEESLLNYSSPNSVVLLEQLCYNCHSKNTRASGGPGDKYDFYSTIWMSDSAKMIETSIVAKVSGHPIESEIAAGRHKIDEYYSVPATYDADSAGAGSGWNREGGSIMERHIECVDCHNTHGGNATIIRTLGTNEISGAQVGAWGVDPSYSNVDGQEEQPLYRKVAQVSKQHELCLKCHSAFSYYTAQPLTPSGRFSNDPAAAFGDLNYGTKTQTDVGLDFSPNAHGYHPIVKKGRNQPPINANAFWPNNTGGNGQTWFGSGPTQTTIETSTQDYINQLTGATEQDTSREGLDWTFVPPFDTDATIACSDCHRADNTGKAAARVEFKTGQTVPTPGSWTGANETNLAKWGDNKAASTTTAVDVLGVYVDHVKSAPGPDPTDVYVVAYACSEATAANQQKPTLQGCPDATCGVPWDSGTVNVPYCASAAGAVRVQLLLGTTPNWAAIKSGTAYVSYMNDANAGLTAWVDYLGLAAYYVETADVRGPHGSLNNWILTDVDEHIRIDVNLDGDFVDDVDAINSLASGSEFGSGASDYNSYKKMFCFNCHRKDVYDGQDDSFEDTAGGTYNPNAHYSRVVHPLEAAAADDTRNPWGIWCLNCHGARLFDSANGTAAQAKYKNPLHGSFADTDVPSTTNGSSQGTLNRPRGVRLLTGANLIAFDVPVTAGGYSLVGGTWDTYTAGITCYTGGGDDALGNCAQHDGGGADVVKFKYTYAGW